MPQLVHIIIIVLMSAFAMWYAARCYSRSKVVRDLYDEAGVIYDELNTKFVPQGEPSPSKITDYMYLGDAADARDLEKIQQLGITHILNCADLPLVGTRYSRPQNIEYKGLPIVDHPFFDIAQYFKEADEFIENARKSGGKILVHCMAGVSRSATMVAYHLMQHHEMTARQALKFTKQKRNKICPNIGFIQQLLSYECLH